MKQIITRVDDELASALKRQAAGTGESVNAYVNRLLRVAVVGPGSPRHMWKAAAGRWSIGAARDANRAASKLGDGLQDGRQHARRLRRRDGQHRAKRTLILFADTSALGSAYLGDEIDAEWIGNVLFEGSDPVVICELADIEFAGLLARAKSGGRIDEAGLTERLDAYDDHTADEGPIGVVPLTHATLVRARELVLRTSVRTLDALHLAAAGLLAEASDDTVMILTNDARQATAAEALGFALYART